ncbi:MAG: hypothetical protein RL104_915, partial [Bacteroidota bacterium]
MDVIPFTPFKGWLPAAEADDLLASLEARSDWTLGRIRMFGREVPEPRLTIFEGDPGVRYTYAHRPLEGRGWSPELEALRDRFERVVVLSPRETIAEEVVLVGRQRIHRRFFERGIEVKTWVDPVWSEHFENTGCLQYRSVFGGPVQNIENVAFFAYASPRRPDD